MPPALAFVAGEPKARGAMLGDYRRTLVAPLDDMWAAFAENAHQFTMMLDGEPLGFFSVNDDRELHAFHVRKGWEHHAGAFFRDVLVRQSICAAFPATVDPAFLSVCLDRARSIDVKALLFQHVTDPTAVRNPLATMRQAQEADFAACVAFARDATGMSLDFLEPYLTARIRDGEFLLHELDAKIAGVGEFRQDSSNPDYAQLGVMVGKSVRGRGLGGAIMNYLVDEAARRHRKPICSTEPTNLAARHIIEHAGFRARHRVLRVAFAPSTMTE